MSWISAAYTHGGISFYRKVLSLLQSNGWTRLEDIEDRSGLAAATLVQRNTIPVDIDVSGIATGVWFDLPVMFLGAFTAYKGFTTPATEGVDFDISRVRGQVRLRSGGIFDNGAGFGIGHFTLAQGYEIRRGWTILSSVGSSGVEPLYIGMRFDALGPSPDNPLRVGIRWSLFRSWVVGVSDYDSASLSFRNAAADDVRQFIHPTADYEISGSFTIDRVLVSGRAAGFGAWACVGALTRFRPQIEQDCVSAMVGNRTDTRNGDEGPIGTTNDPGGVVGTGYGSCWLYDLGVFASGANSVNLNENYWGFDAGATSYVYTPSKRLLNSPAPGGTPQYYFELHDAIVGKNSAVVHSATNVLYGLWPDLKLPLLHAPQHGLVLAYDGTPYQVVGVGDSATRFVAFAKV